MRSDTDKAPPYMNTKLEKILNEWILDSQAAIEISGGDLPYVTLAKNVLANPNGKHLADMRDWVGNNLKEEMGTIPPRTTYIVVKEQMPGIDTALANNILNEYLQVYWMLNDELEDL